MKTISKIFCGGAVLCALMSVTFCTKSNIDDVDGDNGPVFIDERANCFMVLSGSYISFDPCKGNSSENAEMTSAGLVWQDNKSMIESVEAKDGKVVVKIAAGKEGNAVVCAMNGKDTTWSWNLWVIDEPVLHYVVDSVTVMDRNLGALSVNSFDESTIGNVYQWGRKDAWAGLKYFGGFKPMYDINGKEIKRGMEQIADTCYNNVEGAIARPMTHFYKAYSSTAKGNSSWVTADFSQEDCAHIDTLWSNDKKTMYDPCPAGYQVAPSWIANAIKGKYMKADAMDTAMVKDLSYVAPKEVSDTWAEKYAYRYSKQVQFRGGKYGPLYFMAAGEITHELKISTNTNVGGLQPACEFWVAKMDPKFNTSKSNLRAIAAYQTASFVSADNMLKMNAITTKYLNLSHELQIRCVKEFNK